MQDIKSTYKSELYFYILAMKNLKLNEENISICNSIKNNKILMNKFNKINSKLIL